MCVCVWYKTLRGARVACAFVLLKCFQSLAVNTAHFCVEFRNCDMTARSGLFSSVIFFFFDLSFHSLCTLSQTQRPVCFFTL